MKRLFKLSQISIFVGIFLTSCLGSKFLKGDEQLLVKKKIKGISGPLKDNAEDLYEQDRNSRLGFGVLPFTHLAHLHVMGEEGVRLKRNVDRLELRKNDLKSIYGDRINRSTSRKTELQQTLERKISRKDEKINRTKSRIEKKIVKRKSKLTKNEKKYNQRLNKTRSASKRKKVADKYAWSKLKKESRIERLENYKWIGLGFFDVDIVTAKRDSMISEFDERIEEETKTKKQQKLRNRKAKKVDKKNRTIKQGNQLMRWGEVPAVYNDRNSEITTEKITQYLNSKGYFNAKVEVDTSKYEDLGIVGRFGRSSRNWVSRWFGAKKRYINLEYNVTLNQRYYIDSIEYEIQDSVLQDLIFENLKAAPLKKSYYDQDVLSQERDFIFNLAVNNGYFEFSKQYIGFKVDSVQLGQDTLIVREVIKNPANQDHHEIYYLDSIIFVTDASVSEKLIRTEETYGDITFQFGRNHYSKKVLEWRVPLEQDDPYSRDLTIETQRQLSYLDNFKFININYDTTGNYFVANIFTSPFSKYQTSSEFGLSRTQGRPGPFVNINLKNRNTFRTLEILSFDANARLEDLRSVREGSDFDGNYTSRQFGAEVAITFPQFLFPLGSYYKNKMGQFNPKTRVSFGFSFEDRINEYQRTTYRGTYTYSWQLRDQIRYQLTPLELSITDSRIVPGPFQDFIDTLLLQNNPYALAFEPAVVTSSAFQMDWTIGKYATFQEGAYLRFNAEIGGNLTDLVGESFFGRGLETFQYAKTQIDLRQIKRLSRDANLAGRISVGLAYPYGDNQSLPYEKYFFAGGSSSIRAWKPRRLGPGAYGVFEEDSEGNSTNNVDFDNEQRGELIIESSLELRQDLVGFLEGAIFIDAGNIWAVRNSLVEEPDEEGDDGVFKFNRFLDEMAVGTGVGLRFDLQFLVFRVDLGMKLIDPAQLRGERFVGREIFTDFNRNTEVNIGIGYPF